MEGRRTRALLSQVALIGALLALGGVGQLVSGPVRISQIIQYMHQPQIGSALGLDLSQAEIYRQGALAFLGLLGIIAGVGLLLRARWARVMAVLVLGVMSLVELAPLATQVAPQLLKVIAPGLPLSIYLPFLRDAFSIVFRALVSVLLLLALLTPAVRRASRDRWKTGPGDRWAAWLAARVPPGVPAVTALLALLFLCWSAPTFLHYQGVVQSVYRAQNQLFAGITALFDLSSNNGYRRLLLVNIVGSWITLLLPIGYLLAGAGLLFRYPWARYVGLASLALAIGQYLPGMLAFVLLPGANRSQFPLYYLVLSFTIVLAQMAYYAVIMDFLARNPVAPVAERVIERSVRVGQAGDQKER